jgi:hypothetical protein
VTRRRRLVLLALTALSGTVAGAWAWRRAHPPADARYEEIPRAAYERWMQDLGYTE